MAKKAAAPKAVKKVASPKPPQGQQQAPTPAPAKPAGKKAAMKIVRNLSTPEAKAAEAPPKPSPPPKPVQKEAPPREVLYDDVKVRVYRTNPKTGADDRLKAEDAKKLLGWDESKEATVDRYTLIDMNGSKVRCWNNAHNRAFDAGLARMWASEVLACRWKLNGETMIIGETGETISAQHRLAGLVFAKQEWEKNREKYPQWETEPAMDCIVVTGVKEADDTVNTIDTGRPRSLADVIFRSDVFADITKESERKQVARMTAYALKFVWSRTGANSDAFAPGKHTHGDSMDFISRHPRLLNFVRHVWEEDGGNEKRISKYLSPGYAAGLCFLMACSATEQEQGNAWRKEGSSANEDMLNWSLQDRAEEFWVAVSGGDKSVSPAIRTAMDLPTHSDDDAGGLVEQAERIAIIAKAWAVFAALGKNGEIKPSQLELKYTGDGEERVLDETPTVGGIDIGKSADDTTDSEHPAEASSPVQVPAKKAAGRKPAHATGEWSERIGQPVSVNDNGNVWNGTVKKVYSTQHAAVADVEDEEGREYQVELTKLSPAA